MHPFGMAGRAAKAALANGPKPGAAHSAAQHLCDGLAGLSCLDAEVRTGGWHLWVA